MVKGRVRKIVFASIFIALNIILTRIFSYSVRIGNVVGIRLSLSQVPLVLSGIMLGPLYGGLTGALADLLGFPINPTGPYFPGFTISAAVMGLVPGLIGKLIKDKWNLVSLSITIVITTVLASTILNSIWIYILSGKAIMLLLPPRILANLITIPIYIFLVNLFLKNYRKLEGQLEQRK
ncbi:MAG: folate family ECF transporter S component [Caldicoprobacterales bacterium]|nr:folate family ECF transporter S component [Clostridia bacterium]MDI9512249.1 folate family ECF transporter S component [Bacillota bacterium]